MDFDAESFNDSLTMTALGLMASDLHGTAQFTREGSLKEMNPLARPFVKGKSSYGEAGLGLAGALGLITSEKYKDTAPSWLNPTLKAAMILGHGLAVANNANNGLKDGIIVPPLMLRFTF